jgi:tetratricopeptide (TPR) repeat protein
MPEAISCWQEAMVHLGEAGDWIMAALLNWHVGDAYLQMGNLDAAFAYYRTMSEIGLAHGDSSLVGDMVGKESYEAARYGQLDRALETKWLALSYAGPRGDWYTEAWTTWEMGELQRLRGELDEAITWFERALLLFNRIDSRSGDAFYHRGLGDVAASRGFHAVAAFHFEESLRYAEEDRHPWARAYALIGLARANLALGSLPLAQEQMARALDTARATGDRAITLAALAGAAEYLAACGRTGLASEVAAAVAANPISWTETRTRAANVLAPTPLPESTPAAGSPASDVWALAAMASSQLAPPGEERADVAAPQDVPQRSALS